MGSMAVDFLSDEQVAGFGGFPGEVPAEDLERFCWCGLSQFWVRSGRVGQRVNERPGYLRGFGFGAGSFGYSVGPHFPA